MEEKNNKDTYVHDILSMIGAKKGDRFYCTVCGYVALDTNGEESLVFSALKSEEKKCFTTRPDGKMYETGDVIVFPSKTVRDWGKLKTAKGDVVVSEVGSYAIFEKWASNSNYSRMIVRHIVTPNGVYSDNGIWLTECTSRLEPDSMCERSYLEKLQNEHGILNPETLELNKKDEFKEGDILHKGGKGDGYIFILKGIDHQKKRIYRYVNCDELRGEILYESDGYMSFSDTPIRKADEGEVQKLFDVLYAKGLIWNEKKLCLYTFPRKFDNDEQKPFAKVLCRNQDNPHWMPQHLLRFDDNSFYSMEGGKFEECIPYDGNEGFAFRTCSILPLGIDKK